MKMEKRIVAFMVSFVMMCIPVLTCLAADNDTGNPGSKGDGHYELTVIQGENGNIEVADEAGEVLLQNGKDTVEVAAGTKLGITVVPDADYNLIGMKANGAVISLGETHADYTMPEKNVIFEAVYEKKDNKGQQMLPESKEGDDKLGQSVQKETVGTENQEQPVQKAEQKEENPGQPTQDEEKEIPGLDKRLLCDDPDCMEKHVGKTLRPEDVTGVLEGKKDRTQIARTFVQTPEPYVGMTTSGSNADIYFTGSDPSAPGLFTIGLNDGDYLAGITVDGFECLDHGAANPGVGIAVQGTYEATVISVDKTGGKVNWSVVVTPPGAAAPGTVLGFQRVGGVLSTDWDFTDYGNIVVQKESNNPQLTDDNPCYSLEGAEFSIYEQGTDKLVTKITTDEKGYGRADNIESRTYDIVETKAPKGFALDSARHQITVKAGKTMTYEFIDKAQNDPVYILLGKIDVETNKNEPTGSAALEDAEFTVKFYKGFYDTDPSEQGKAAERTWILKTDDKGFTYLNDQYKVSGDEFYILSGIPTLPLGTITIQETKAPQGYLINPEVYVRKITSEGAAESVNTYNQPIIPEQVIRGGVYVEKWDNQLNQNSPQGGASLQGAKLQVISDNENPILAGDKTFSKGEVITTLTTGADGSASTAANLLPYGDYIMREQSPPPGYIVSGVTERRFQIRKNGEIVRLDTNDTAIKDDIISGGVEIEKWDSETNQNSPQGGATLKGAEFQLSSLNDSPVIVEGNSYNKNDLINTFQTDEDGKVKLASNYLPAGKYRWTETVPPEGYNHTGILQRDFEIKNNGEIVKLNTSDTAIKNDIIRGDLQLVKFQESQDEDEDQKVPLEGIIFTLTSKTTGDKFEIVTDKNGYATTKQLGISDRGNLVYDTYTVHESNTPEGLKPVKDFDMTIKNENETLYYILEDKLILSPVKFLKTDATTGERIPLAGAEFQLLDKDKNPITMTTHYPDTVVHHTFKTDGSGSFTLPQKLQVGTYYWREVQAPEGYQRNPEDMKFTITAGHDWEEPFIVEFEDTPAMGKIRIVKTDKETGMPLKDTVFEIRAAEDITTPDGTVRVQKGELADTIKTSENGMAESKTLFLGKYLAAETKQSPGYVLPGKSYEVELKYKDQETEIVTGDLNITNVPTEIIIDKKVTGSEQRLSGVKFAVWNKVMTDGEDPGITAREMIKTDREGKAVIKKLMPDTTYCIQEVSGVSGYMTDGSIREIYIDENGKIDGKGSVTVTVENPKTEITGTKAVSADTATQEGIPKKAASIQDTVSLKNLQAGETYTIKGILMDKETMLPLYDGNTLMLQEITSEKTFTATEKEMNVEMVFFFDATKFAGKTAVVFERAYIGKNEIASHTDINDTLQMVSFPKSSISTKARNSDTGTQEAIAGKEVTVVDTVEYRNLIVGQEYTLKGTLMDKSTGRPLPDGKKEVAAQTAFIPDKKDGTTEVKFTFNASGLAGKEVVVFEKLYVQGAEAAVHTDIDDKEQTIAFPEGKIQTSARDKETGTKEVIAKKNAAVIDTVTYENLIAGQPYTTKGILMDKATGRPVLADGKQITAEKEFVPKEKKGAVDVEFTFNASNLNDKNLVVFEKVYSKDTEVATHEDISDLKQTVAVKLGKLSVKMPGNGRSGLWTGIKTGDRKVVLPILLALAGSLAMIFGITAYRLKRRNRKNEEE